MNAPWLNGAPDASALATHRGLHYGDGVFRTCLVAAGQVVLLERQLAQLARDAAKLDLEGDAAALQREAGALVRGMDRGVLKLMLLRAGGERGYRSKSRDADRLLCTYPLPQYPQASRGIRAERANFKLATQTTLAGIKHLNRLEQVLATRNIAPGVDEVVLEDAEGRPVCGSRSNLFWVQGAVAHTPPVERCGVAGLTRERLLEQGARVSEASFEALENADEMFFTNSLIGIWPVRSFGARAFGAPGPATRQLMAALRHPEL